MNVTLAKRRTLGFLGFSISEVKTSHKISHPCQNLREGVFETRTVFVTMADHGTVHTLAHTHTHAQFTRTSMYVYMYMYRPKPNLTKLQLARIRPARPYSNYQPIGKRRHPLTIFRLRGRWSPKQLVF